MWLGWWWRGTRDGRRVCVMGMHRCRVWWIVRGGCSVEVSRCVSILGRRWVVGGIAREHATGRLDVEHTRVWGAYAKHMVMHAWARGNSRGR